MRIVYIYKRSNGTDGQSIFDEKLLESLSRVSEVRGIPVTGERRGWPFWVRKLSKGDIELIGSITPHDLVIVSHESLSGLLKYIFCHIFIIHNHIPISRIAGILGVAYRIGSANVFNLIWEKSEKVALLSHRESRMESRDSILLTPGFNDRPSELIDGIGVLNSNGWLLKKLNRLESNQFYYLLNEFGRIVNSISCQYLLIEDRFDMGFKLKLLQGLYSSVIIYSFVDLTEEITSRGLSADNFILVNDIDDIKRIAISENRINTHKQNKRLIERDFSWELAANTIVTNLNEYV